MREAKNFCDDCLCRAGIARIIRVALRVSVKNIRVKNPQLLNAVARIQALDDLHVLCALQEADQELGVVLDPRFFDLVRCYFDRLFNIWRAWYSGASFDHSDRDIRLVCRAEFKRVQHGVSDDRGEWWRLLSDRMKN